jgi:autotransporter-associated beta strand protein
MLLLATYHVPPKWGVVLLFLSVQLQLFSAAHTINYSTWIDFENFNASDPGGSTKLVKALNLAGTTPTALFGDASADTTYNGDLIELGFFKDLGDDGAIGGSGGNADTASATLFKGLWTPLTSKTTIGHDASIITSLVPFPTTTQYAIPNGEFGFNVVINNNDATKDDDTAYINPGGANTNYSIADQLSGGSTDISDNYVLLEAATNPLLGIRFYDVNTANFTSGGTTKATDGSTRYNTIMDAAWVWPGDGADPLNMVIYEKGSGAATPTLDASLVFEFDNTDAHTANLAKVGTAHTRIENDDYVATVTYHNGSSNLDLDASGKGSTVLSGLSGSGNLLGGDDGSTLTIHSAAGNTGTDAFDFTGNIYESSSASTDLSILKTGSGDQELTGNINLAAGSGENTGYINLTAGGLTLNPGSGETQVIEYLKGASGTTLTLDNTGASTIELGFAQSQSGATFSGGVVLTGTGSSNIIKVATGTTAADYAKEQVFATGVISGSEKLAKSGVGRLKLTGDNTFSGGMDINDGTVVAGHNDALGSGTVTINKGKLEVSSGVTISETIQGGSGKSLIGGDGTVSSVIIGSGANEVDYLSPGQGISSSLSPSQKQVGLGNGTADDAIGSFTATNLSLQGGGVYDWEMQDFDGTAGGTDYDVMNFTNLSFGSSSDRFTINIMGIKSSDGTAGGPDNLANIWAESKLTTNGFKFLDGTSSGSGITWGAWANDGSDINDYFDIRYDDLAYNISNNGQYNQWGQAWSVHYDSGDFYLQFSAAPEPSTYIMVTGLFMLPGFRMFRKWRKKFSSSTTEDSEEV